MKNSPKPPWNLLCVGQLFVGMGPIWSVVDIPSDPVTIHLRKSIFLFSVGINCK